MATYIRGSRSQFRNHVNKEKQCIVENIRKFHSAKEDIDWYMDKLIREAEETAAPLLNETSTKRCFRKLDKVKTKIACLWHQMLMLVGQLVDPDGEPSSDESVDSNDSVESNVTSVSRATFAGSLTNVNEARDACDANLQPTCRERSRSEELDARVLDLSSDTMAGSEIDGCVAVSENDSSKDVGTLEDVDAKADVQATTTVLKSAAEENRARDLETFDEREVDACLEKSYDNVSDAPCQTGTDSPMMQTPSRLAPFPNVSLLPSCSHEGDEKSPQSKKSPSEYPQTEPNSPPQNLIFPEEKGLLVVGLGQTLEQMRDDSLRLPSKTPPLPCPFTPCLVVTDKPEFMKLDEDYRDFRAPTGDNDGGERVDDLLKRLSGNTKREVYNDEAEGALPVVQDTDFPSLNFDCSASTSTIKAETSGCLPDTERCSAGESYGCSRSSLTSERSSVVLYDTAKIARHSLAVNDVVEGMILSVDDPDRFWIQTEHEEMDYATLQQIVENRCSRSQCRIEATAIVGIYCCAKSTFDNTWSRVKVLELLDEDKRGIMVKVFFIDTGFTETIGKDCLVKMPTLLSKCPPLAVACRLGEIVPNEAHGWSKLCVDTFTQLVYGMEVRATVLDYQEEDVYTVRLMLCDAACSQDQAINVAEMLTVHQLAKRMDDIYVSDEEKEEVEVNATESRSTSIAAQCLEPAKHPGSGDSKNTDRDDSKKPLEDHVIDCEGRKFMLRAVLPPVELDHLKFEQALLSYCESPTSFYVHQVSNSVTENVSKFHCEMSVLYDSGTVKFAGCKYVQRNSFWAARFSGDGLWYRVRVLKLRKRPTKQRRRMLLNEASESDDVFIHYVDYGNCEYVPVTSLRPLLESHCCVPPLAIHCSLADIFPYTLQTEQRDMLSADSWEWDRTVVEYFLQNMVVDKVYSLEVVSAEFDTLTEKRELLHVHLWDLNIKNKPVNINEQLVKARFAMSTIYSSDTFSEPSSELINWKPMEEDYYSERNTYAVDDEDAEAVVTGISLKDSRMCLNKSCTRIDCRFDHVNVPSEDPRTKVTSFVLGTLTQLPEVNSSVAVSITAIFNPGHFYVVFPFGPLDINEYCCDGEIKLEVQNLDFQEILEEMNSSYKQSLPAKNPNVHFLEGEVCAVFCPYDNKWVRACINELNVQKNEALLFYLDYGNQDWVPFDVIYPLKSDFATIPYQAVECFLANVEPVLHDRGWSAAARNWFDDFVATKILTAHVEAVDDKVLHVELYDGSSSQTESIGDMLIGRNYASRIKNHRKAGKRPVVENSTVKVPA